jgi:lysophospholipase L1-like esterase
MFSGHGLRRLLAVVTAVSATVAGLTATMASADSTVTVTSDAVALGRALSSDVSWVTGASFVTKAGTRSAALVSGGVAGMPITGPEAALLSTGDATLITTPNGSGSSGSDVGGPSVRGDSDFDVTILRVDLQVPASANCLVGLDFRFLSEEYPEFVGSRFNDAFVAELDKTTWTTSGSTISAPDNFAFDPTGSPITINAAGTTSMSAAEAAGTTFDGATPLLTAATPLSPGAHSLYLSIFDQGDHIYDSAAIIDNLRLGTVDDVATDCKAGAKVIDRTAYVALGDSYSSGFGVSPYFPGTHKDAGDNDCQRSTRAYGPRVADAKGLNLEFHACQGAVTKDFYNARNSTWGEVAQLDNLEPDTGLVTFSIGGNDAKFAQVLRDCIDGFELLPFNTCYNDDKVTDLVRDAFDRLDGKTSTPADITPYGKLYSDVVSRTPIAARVAVGYPHFYTASGGDRTFLPGGRCEGVKKVDQRWMVEQIDELNGIIERNAKRNGFLFANPNPRFDKHELCSGGTEWIYPVFSSGQIHPTVEGQQAMADSVLATLDAGGFQTFTVLPQQRVTYSFVVGSGKQFISLVSGWPGSDVSLTVVSPSGRRIDRTTMASDVSRVTGATSEHVEVANPEPGTWTAELFGVDVAPAGEQTTLSVYQADLENQRPTGRITVRVVDNALVLDGSTSTDPDGSIRSSDWYITTPSADDVKQGASITVPLDSATERTFTLVVTDSRGATDFADLAWVPIDVMPGSSLNPVKVASAGKTPIAILSTPTFDATTVAPTTVRVGPNAAQVEEVTAAREDVNGDGRLDQVVHVVTTRVGLSLQSTQLCLSMTLPNGRAASSCDVIRAQ